MRDGRQAPGRPPSFAGHQLFVLGGITRIIPADRPDGPCSWPRAAFVDGVLVITVALSWIRVSDAALAARPDSRAVELRHPAYR